MAKQLYAAMNADHHQPHSNFSRKEPGKNLSRQMVLHKILKQIHTTVYQSSNLVYNQAFSSPISLGITLQEATI